MKSEFLYPFSLILSKGLAVRARLRRAQPERKLNTLQSRSNNKVFLVANDQTSFVNEANGCNLPVSQAHWAPRKLVNCGQVSKILASRSNATTLLAKSFSRMFCAACANVCLYALPGKRAMPNNSSAIDTLVSSIVMRLNPPFQKMRHGFVEHYQAVLAVNHPAQRTARAGG